MTTSIFSKSKQVAPKLMDASWISPQSIPFFVGPGTRLPPLKLKLLNFYFGTCILYYYYAIFVAMTDKIENFPPMRLSAK